MALTLALLEGCAIFAVVSGALLVWSLRLPGGWGEVLAVLALAAGLSVCTVVAFYFADLYNPRMVRSFHSLLGRLPRAVAWAAVLLAGFLAAVPSAVQMTEGAIQAGMLLTIAIVFGPLVPLRAMASRTMRRQRFAKRLLIVGTSPLARRLIEEVERRSDCRHSIVGIVEEGTGKRARPLHRAPAGSLDALDRIIEEARPDRIVVALADRRGRLPTQRLLAARVYGGLPVDDGAALYEQLTGKLAIEALPPSEVIFCQGFSQSPISLGVRHGFSVLVAALGLAMAAPLFGLIALAIKLDSPGSVFFAQRRIGLRGRPFTLLKFRTMHATETPPSEWVRDNGHRITRVGRWLRLFWLDELPQLVNILRGEMDLVGPRAHPVSNFELLVLVSRNVPECGEPIPYYALRCMVRPGMTGWAQVRYRYANDLEEEIEKLRYDLYYIKHRSVWLDLRILFDTLKKILDGRSPAAPQDREGETFAGTPVRLGAPALLQVHGNGGSPHPQEFPQPAGTMARAEDEPAAGLPRF